jgi:hypothetical protein
VLKESEGTEKNDTEAEDAYELRKLLKSLRSFWIIQKNPITSSIILS